MPKTQELSHYKYAEDINSFFLKHTAILVNRAPRTIRRWLKEGIIRGTKSEVTRWWYISLSEINRIRKEDNYPSLDGQEAIEILKQKYEAQDDKNR